MTAPTLQPLTIPAPGPSSPDSTVSDDSALLPITPGNNGSPPPSANPAGKKKSTRRANTAERRATHNAVERQRRETLNGRFLELAGLLPNLSQIRRPSKSAIVTSSIAFIHASRRHRALASRELRACKAESDALRRELNEWRHRANLPRIDEPQRSDGFGIVLSGELELDMEVPQDEDFEDDMGAEDGMDEVRDIKPTGLQQISIANASPTVSYENPAMPVAWEHLQQQHAHQVQPQHITLPINIAYPPHHHAAQQPPAAKSWEAAYTMAQPPHHFPESYPRVPSLLDKYAAAAAVTNPSAQFAYAPPSAGITHQQMMAAAAAAQRSLFTPPHSAHGLPSPSHVSPPMSADGQYFYRAVGRERSGSGVGVGVGTADDIDSLLVARGVQVPTLPGGPGAGGIMAAMF